MGLVEFKNISLMYDNKIIFKDLNFKLNENETTVILARSGGGLSQFLKLAAGITLPTSGTVLINGVDTKNARKKDLMQVKSKMGFYFQDNALFSGLSLYDNLAFYFRFNTNKSEKEIAEIIYSSILHLNISEEEEKTLASHLPSDLKKVVNFLRATLHKPKILFLDDFFTSDDTHIIKILYKELYNYISKNIDTTILFSSSSLKNLSIFVKRVIVIANGEIYFDNSLDSFMIIANSDKVLNEFLENY